MTTSPPPHPAPPHPPPPHAPQPPHRPPPYDTEYVVPSGLGWKAAGALATGGLMAAAIVFRFATLITADAGSPAPDDGATGSGIVGGLGAGAFILLGYGLSLLRRPVRAKLGARDITIQGFVSSRVVPWEKVAQLRREKKTETVGQETVDVLVLADEKDKSLARLTSSFINFPGLVADVEARSAAARGAPTYDRGADLARKAAAHRRSRRKTVALSSVLTLFGLTCVSWGGYEWRVDRSLRTDGVDAQAVIDRHYMKSVTGWLDFHFTDPATGRRVDRSTSLERDAWRSLTGQKTVTVRYVPSRPDWNEVSGEGAGESSPLLMLGLGSALTLVFVAILVVTALGYSDITVKDGKMRVKRFGDVDDDLEAAAALPAYPVPGYPVPAQPGPQLPGQQHRPPMQVYPPGNNPPPPGR